MDDSLCKERNDFLPKYQQFRNQAQLFTAFVVFYLLLDLAVIGQEINL